jgi:hypothetical protein
MIKKALPYVICGLLVVTLFYQSSESAKWEALANAHEKAAGDAVRKHGGAGRKTDATPEQQELVDKVAEQQAEISKLRQENSQVPKLQAEVARLQGVEGVESGLDLAGRMAKLAAVDDDPFAAAVMALASKAADLNRQVQNRPAFDIPELQLLEEADWLSIAKGADYETEQGIRQTLSKTRQKAKTHFAEMATEALNQFYAANNNQPPASPTQLQPYFKTPVDPSILQRYQMIPSTGLGSLSELGPVLISEKSPVDRQYDTHFYVGRKGVASFMITPAGTSDPDVTWATR